MTTAAVASPAAAPRIRPATARGRLSASTTTMTAAVTPSRARVSSAMNSWAASSRPSQAPVRTGRPRPVNRHSSASTVSGSRIANCRW